MNLQATLKDFTSILEKKSEQLFLPNSIDPVEAESERQRMLDRVARSLKELQLEFAATATSSGTVLNANLTRKLCAELEIIFRYGLKEKGFIDRSLDHALIQLISGMTCKTTMSALSNLQRVYTDAGRFRSWIRIAMNENALESYLSVLAHDQALAKDYYHPYAFFHDSERVGILLTLISGISNIRFAMPIDDPLLNEVNVFPMASEPLVPLRVSVIDSVVSREDPIPSENTAPVTSLSFAPAVAAAPPTPLLALHSDPLNGSQPPSLMSLEVVNRTKVLKKSKSAKKKKSMSKEGGEIEDMTMESVEAVGSTPATPAPTSAGFDVDIEAMAVHNVAVDEVSIEQSEWERRLEEREQQKKLKEMTSLTPPTRERAETSTSQEGVIWGLSEPLPPIHADSVEDEGLMWHSSDDNALTTDESDALLPSDNQQPVDAIQASFNESTFTDEYVPRIEPPQRVSVPKIVEIPESPVQLFDAKVETPSLLPPPSTLIAAEEALIRDRVETGDADSLNCPLPNILEAATISTPTTAEIPAVSVILDSGLDQTVLDPCQSDEVNPVTPSATQPRARAPSVESSAYKGILSRYVSQASVTNQMLQEELRDIAASMPSFKLQNEMATGTMLAEDYSEAHFDSDFEHVETTETMSDRASNTSEGDLLKKRLLSSKELFEQIDQLKNMTQPDNEAARETIAKRIADLQLKLEDAKKYESRLDKPKFHFIKGHEFKEKTFTTPTYCELCGGLIVGLYKQGFRCRVCKLDVHQKCMEETNRKCISQEMADSVYIKDICREMGLDSQSFKCPDCKRQIGFKGTVFLEARLCDYSGKYYCPDCHWQDLQYIPARVVHNWDFRLQKVSRMNMQFLKSMMSKAVIFLDKENSMIGSYVEEYSECRTLRERLVMMQAYISSCRLGNKLKIPKELKSRLYLLEHPSLYSMQDLIELSTGTLIPLLKRIHAVYSQHITQECELCSQKGFVCEICNDSKYIFNFQEGMHKCVKCSSLFHRACFTDGMACPKCTRIDTYMKSKK